jgi:hypothetical protein
MGLFPWGNDPTKIAHRRNVEAWINIFDQFDQELERLGKNVKDSPNSSFYEFEDWLKGKVTGVVQPAYLPGQPALLSYKRPAEVVNTMNRGLDTLRTELTRAFMKISKAWSGYEQAHAEPTKHPDHPANAIDDFSTLEREMRGILSFYWEFYAIIEGTDAADAKRRETATLLQIKAEEEAKQDEHRQTELQKNGVALRTAGYRHRFAEFSDVEWKNSLTRDWSRYATAMSALITRLRMTLKTNRNQR